MSKIVREMNLRRLRKVLFLRLAKVLTAILVTFVGLQELVHGEESEVISDDSMVMRELPNFDETNVVEVKSPASFFSKYRDRRPTHGLIFSFAQSKILMDNLTTEEGAEEYYYEDLFGDEPVALSEFHLGYKFNFTLGSLHFDVGYGVLEKVESFSGLNRTLEVRRPSIRMGYILDTLFDEPYVAPYAEAAAWKMNIKEANEVDSVSYTTDFGFTFSAGLLFQLNWIDPNGAFEGRKNFGLQNTYLDLFITKQTAPVNPDDPDTSTDMAYGAGLRVEF
jgi:hypothetical protein